MKLLLSVALFSIIFSAGFSQQNIASFREIGPTQALGDDIYFSATHEQYGVELFVNKGKSKINSLLKDINPGSLNSSPSELTIFNSQVYFIAYSSDYGGSVWKTDGTSEGTQLIYGVNNAHPSGLMVFKDKLYFRTDFGSIMRTDGTAAGTEVFYQSEYTYGR